LIALHVPKDARVKQANVDVHLETKAIRVIVSIVDARVTLILTQMIALLFLALNLLVVIALDSPTNACMQVF